MFSVFLLTQVTRRHGVGCGHKPFLVAFSRRSSLHAGNKWRDTEAVAGVLVESFRLESENEDALRALSARGLVLCFCFCFVLVFVLASFVTKDWKQPVWRFLPGFVTCFHGKKSRYDRNNAVSGWHTRRWRRVSDFWWVAYIKLTFANLALVKTTFPQNFVVDERTTTSFPPARIVTDNYACGLRPSKRTRNGTRLRSDSFSDIKLSSRLARLTTSWNVTAAVCPWSGTSLKSKEVVPS